jgi:DNA (cytosine-5)-methyltransferase 1
MSLRTKAEKTPACREGARLRLIRNKLAITRDELAEKTRYSAKTIARWERGEDRPRQAVILYLEAELAKRAARGVRDDFRFIDLFAGIGGMRLGFEGAGGRCVFTSEWDKNAQKTYMANFGGEEPHGDITKVDLADIPEFDVLLAGFPCQPFSLAGVSKKNSLGRAHGFECKTQGTLFFDIERILNERRPRAFLLENVKNLQSHDGGNTWRTIRRVLRDELGYHIHPMVVDAKRFVPQHRERIFIVGFRDEVGFNWEDDVILPPKDEGPKLSSILHPTDGSDIPEEPYTDAQGRVNKKYILSDHLWDYLQNYAKKHQAAGNGFGFGLVGPNDVARTLSARYHKDGSEILIRRGRGNPRRLTPRECARLMGFDRDGRKWIIPVSDTQAYRQFGNSVAVPVVEAIARAMRPYIMGRRVEREQQEELALMAS